MKPLPDIVSVLPPAQVPSGGEEVRISNLAMRLDDVHRGSLFFCVPGSSHDGHDFAAEAVDRGAVALVVERELSVDKAVPQVVVGSCRAAIGPAADVFFDHPSRELEIFGVTGTNGKTTTTHLLYAMLEAAGRRPGLIGTVGAKLGGSSAKLGFTTPEAPELHRLLREMVDHGHQSCAMEVSSHALEQKRVQNVRFASTGFTNLTRDHMDFHRSFEAYYLAKRKLFEHPGPEGVFAPAAVNCDDEWGSRLFDELVHADRNEVPVWGYTLQNMPRSSVSAKYRLTSDGATISLETPVGDFTLQSHLRGRFNVENVVCATTMAMLAGLDPAHIQQGLEQVTGVPGRFEQVASGQPFDVFVDYAHTPDSLENVLETARDICEGNLIVVFGCGGDRDRSKRPLMGGVAADLADFVVVTSDNPRSEAPDAIIDQVVAGTKAGRAQVVTQPDRRAAIATALEQARADDVVIIAGKGHEQGQDFGDRVVEFDDATVCREELEALAVS